MEDVSEFCELRVEIIGLEMRLLGLSKSEIELYGRETYDEEMKYLYYLKEMLNEQSKASRVKIKT